MISVSTNGDDRRTFDLPGGGLKCGSCGAVLPRVARTTATAGLVIRERICPQCNMLNQTTERVIATRTRNPWVRRKHLDES